MKQEGATSAVRSTKGRASTRQQRDTYNELLDAAERLLEREGAVGITTRKVANEAGINPALVHYYFESIEELCAKVIERVSDDLIDRQRRIFSGPSLTSQWREATEPLRSNVGRRRMKVWFELSAMAVNRPVLLRRMVEVNAAWRQIIRDAVQRERERRGLDFAGFSDDAAAALMSVLLKGLYWENLQEFHQGHNELLGAADQLLATFEGETPTPTDAPRRPATARRRRATG